MSCTQVSDQQYSLLFVERTHEPTELTKIYAIRPNGTGKQLLTEFSSRDYWLSPDGNHIAVFTLWGDEKLDVSARTLVIIDVLDGKVVDQISDVGYVFADQRTLYLSNESVVWSPHSNKLLFERNSSVGLGSDLWEYDLDSRIIEPIIQDGLINQNPSWSSDETQIAYVSSHPCRIDEPGNCLPEDSYWNVKVWDVANQIQHTVADFTDQALLPPKEDITPLCRLLWSPNQLYIAFENQCGPFSIVDEHKLFIASVDGLELIQVAGEVEADSETNTYQYSYEWSSRNSLYVGYTRGIYLASESSIGGVLIFDPETDMRSQLVENKNILGSTASWSENQEHVIVFSERIEDYSRVPGSIFFGVLEDESSIVLEEKQDLLPGSCDIKQAYWSPDGQYVIYAASVQTENCDNELGTGGIVVISARNGDAVNVTQSLDPGDYRPLGWVKD